MSGSSSPVTADRLVGAVRGAVRLKLKVAVGTRRSPRWAVAFPGSISHSQRDVRADNRASWSGIERARLRALFSITVWQSIFVERAVILQIYQGSRTLAAAHR